MGAILKNPIVVAAALGAVTGALGAARADYQAFKSWKSVEDALRYDWKLAAWRWFSGAVVGAIGGAGLLGAGELSA